MSELCEFVAGCLTTVFKAVLPTLSSRFHLKYPLFTKVGNTGFMSQTTGNNVNSFTYFMESFFFQKIDRTSDAIIPTPLKINGCCGFVIAQWALMGLLCMLDKSMDTLKVTVSHLQHRQMIPQWAIKGISISRRKKSVRVSSWGYSGGAKKLEVHEGWWLVCSSLEDVAFWL